MSHELKLEVYDCITLLKEGGAGGCGYYLDNAYSRVHCLAGK